MDKKTLIARHHADYAKALAVMSDAIAAVAEARTTLNILNIPTSATAYDELGNMIDVLSNINASVATDYVNDLSKLNG